MNVLLFAMNYGDETKKIVEVVVAFTSRSNFNNFLLMLALPPISSRLNTRMRPNH